MSEGGLPVGGGNSALSLLVSKRPRNVSWRQAAGLLFGDWGTSRLYVLGLALFFAPHSALWLLAAMSLLLLGVGWAYTQICRVYPDGGGVYSAARKISRTLAFVGALLLFADYVVTASLSALDAFHYFGMSATADLFASNSPGLWAMVSIFVIGAMNLLGPRHTGGFAVAAALGMVAATFAITCFALPAVNWHVLPQRLAEIEPHPGRLWVNFVAIVLALSGVEAIGNLAGLMKKPVSHTSRKAIWLVAGEVALFNLLLGIAMVCKLSAAQSAEHKEDMMAFLAVAYVGPWMEYAVRILAGVLLLSAVNTVVSGMISLQYLLSQDGELPAFFQRLNRFGVPWIGVLVATLVPVGVLVISHDLEHLAALYAIGVVGAVAINIVLLARHPRLHGRWRKVLAAGLGVVLLAIWITLATTKLHALLFVSIVLTVGLIARHLTRCFATPASAADLLHAAVEQQLPADALAMPRVMLATAGSSALAEEALRHSQARRAALVVSFIREVSLTTTHVDNRKLRLESDLAAQRMFAQFLHMASQYGVPVIPHYDSGDSPAELLAEAAALMGAEEILLGSSRRGTLHRLIKGSFQRKLEAMLPPEIAVHVLDAGAGLASPQAAPAAEAQIQTAV